MSASFRSLLLAAAPIFVMMAGEPLVHAEPVILPSQSGVADFVPLVHQVKPAVVSISAHIRDNGGEDEGDGGFMEGSPFPFPFPFKMMPMMPSNRVVEARGSGFIISADGYIVTNNHVVKGATKVTVKLDDGTVLSAKIIGRDSDTDLALLKVKTTEKLPYIELGNSDNVQPGEWIVAVGNPYGLGGTVTAGIVSALGRDLHSGAYNDFIQIDAPINRGNSGGPLITLDGKVVGVNSMIMSPNGGGSIGIGFAIPSDTVKSVIEQLRKTGHVTRGYLGIQGQNINLTMAKALNLDAKEVGEGHGVLIASVIEAGPAAKAGLKSGDVVTAMNGHVIKNMHDLAVHVVSLPPGQSVSLSLIRDGKPATVSVIVGKLGESAEDMLGSNGSDAASAGKLGVTLVSLSPRIRQQLGLEESVKGAVVSAVASGSIAEHSGIMAGDVIIGVGNHPTSTPKAVASFVQEALAQKKLPLLQILRDGQKFFVVLSANIDNDSELDDGE